MRRRRGFGLVEMAFVLAMLAGILALLYLIFHQQSAGAKKLDSHQEALRAGLFALETITRDLRSLVTVPPEWGPDGKPHRRYGDHRTPVRISPLGRQIAFLMPAAKAASIASAEQECIPVTYALIPVPNTGLYTLRRTTGAGAAAKGRDLPEVRVRDLRFRLLEPDCADLARRSPDSGYYVQIMLEAADRLDKQVRPLPALVRLDYPSRQAELSGMETRLAYHAASALSVAPEETRATAAEAKLVNELRELARRFTAGKLTAKDFEREVGRALASVAGAAPTALVSGRGARVPNFAELSVQPVQPGRPLTLTDGRGLEVALATLEAQREELGRRGGPTSGQPVSAWWVDASRSVSAGQTNPLAGMLGTAADTYGPLAGADERGPDPAAAPLPVPQS